MIRKNLSALPPKAPSTRRSIHWDGVPVHDDADAREREDARARGPFETPIELFERLAPVAEPSHAATACDPHAVRSSMLTTLRHGHQQNNNWGHGSYDTDPAGAPNQHPSPGERELVNRWVATTPRRPGAGHAPRESAWVLVRQVVREVEPRGLEPLTS